MLLKNGFHNNTRQVPDKLPTSSTAVPSLITTLGEQQLSIKRNAGSPKLSLYLCRTNPTAL